MEGTRHPPKKGNRFAIAPEPVALYAHSNPGAMNPYVKHPVPDFENLPV